MRIIKKSTLCTVMSILLCFSLLLSGCGYSKEETDDKLASVQEQIDSIKSSIPTLEQAGTELNAYIDSLKATAADLQSKLDATNASIETLKSDMSTADTEALEKLNALKDSIEGQIATINTDITALKAKNVELDGKITDLKAYVNSEISATENWANATFATLEQYNAVQTEIAGIKESINTINADISAIENDVATKVATINQSISALDKKLTTKVTEITTAYTEALSTAKTEIQTAYTKAISDAITASETAMKVWVNKTLADGYYHL